MVPAKAIHASVTNDSLILHLFDLEDPNYASYLRGQQNQGPQSWRSNRRLVLCHQRLILIIVVGAREAGSKPIV
jgi:hypothetical protein